MQTRRLCLRQIVDEDLPHIHKGLSDPVVTKYYGVHFTSLQETKKQMEWYASLEKDNSGRWWAICSSIDDTFYGACGLNDLDKTRRKAEIGFWLLPACQGQGIMQEALPLIIAHAFNSLRLKRLEACVETENSASKRLLERLNFNHEGTMPNCEWKNDHYISLDIYALLNNP